MHAHTSSLRTALAVLISLLVFSHDAAHAHGPNDPPHQRYSLGDFKLESGQSILDCEVSFVTHGTLNADKSNAVLVLSAIGGNHHRIDFLIGPDKAFDPAKYFIICVDAIGNGLSISPSNS
jgi:homoserine O-acetyltransferase